MEIPDDTQIKKVRLRTCDKGNKFTGFQLLDANNELISKAEIGTIGNWYE